MSGAEPGEKEKKAKPGLVRLGQNGNARKPALVSLATPKFGMGGAQKSPLAGSPRLGMGLTTFRSPRDLTLGAKPTAKSATKPTERKKFVPNLNVQRIVKKESDEVVKGEKGKRRKENKHERREKNNRDRPTLIQTGSIFSEGIGGDGGIRRRFGGSSTREESAASSLVKPKLELNQKIDREAEEEKLKSILRDDFIDDLKEGSFIPVQLPMIDTGKIFKAEVKKADPSEKDIRPKLIDKKRSVLDSDDSDEELEDPKLVIDAAKTLAPPAADPTVGQLLTQQTGQLVFFQLPDSLPLDPPEGDVKDSPDAQDHLGQLEGLLGRLEIRKSGRCQLILGQQRMDIEVGTKVGFLQDAVSIRLPTTTDPGEGDVKPEVGEGQLTVLGHISHRLVVSPDWDSLLRESGLNDTLA